MIPSASLILASVARDQKVPLLELLSRRRDGETGRARCAAIHLIRDMTALSSLQIGHAVGGRDHSTILSALNRSRQRCRSDPRWAARLETLRHSATSFAAALDEAAAERIGLEHDEVMRLATAAQRGVAVRAAASQKSLPPARLARLQAIAFAAKNYVASVRRGGSAGRGIAYEILEITLQQPPAKEPARV